MKYMNYIRKYMLFLFVIITIVIIIILYAKDKKIERYNNNKNNSSIPKFIYQTYLDKSKIPSKVFDNIKKYTIGYKNIIYDDMDCIKFLKEHYPQHILNTFNTLKRGAHKADLFRYCLLYKYGGIYLDIKTELIKPIDQIFTENYLYTVISKNNNSIYQGIIATPPNNPLFSVLIDHIVNNKDNIKYYLMFTTEFYKQLNILCENKVKSGFNKNKLSNIDIYLFNEVCSKNGNNCYDGLDRYKLCCNIYDKNNKIIKTRYSDYQWH